MIIRNLIYLFILPWVFSGCSLVVLEDFDPRGSDVSVEGFFLIDNQIPNEELCESEGVQTVRLEFYSDTRMVHHPELEFKCTDYIFTKGPVLKYGMFNVRWVAYDSSGIKLGEGPFFRLDALKNDPDLESKRARLPVGRVYLDKGSFYPYGEDVHVNVGWTIDHDSTDLKDQCENLGISTVEVSFFRPDRIQTSDRRVVGVAPCLNGSYVMLRPLVKEGRYQYTIRGLGEDGAVLFESLPEFFNAEQDRLAGLGPIDIDIERVARVKDFPIVSHWQSTIEENTFLLCQDAQVENFRIEVSHQRTGEVTYAGEQSCEEGTLILLSLPEGEVFDVVFHGTSSLFESLQWITSCEAAVGEQAQEVMVCEISRQNI